MSHDHSHHHHEHGPHCDHDHGSPREMLQQAMRLVEMEDLHGAFHLWEHLSVSKLEDADLLQAYGYLGLEFSQEDIAITAFNKALRIDPKLAQSWLLLGNAYRRKADYRAAEKAFRDVIRLEPENIDGIYNLGITLEDQQRYQEAVAELQKGLLISPLDADLNNAIGGALHANAEPEKAIPFYRKAIQLDPDFPALKFNLAQALLHTKQWEEGWQLYDSRLQFRDAERFPQTAAPRWRGEDLKGKSILVWAEQGFGDTIQFVRFVKVLVDMEAEVVLRVQGALMRLLQSLPWSVTLLADDEAQIPTTDFEVPLLSLPLHLEWQEHLSIHNYLSGGECFVPALRQDSELKRIGVVWAGNPNHPDDLKRSMRARDMAPLFQTKGCEFVSLQVGGARQQLQDKSVLVIDEWLDDFKETASAIDRLDLVISVDTAVAHLAGAMGKEVWLLTDYAGDWRWGLDETSTDWYPSMRIFRQDKPGDWAGVIAQVKNALANRPA